MRALAALLVAPLLAACAGSAPSSVVTWDVSGGQYLTDEEFGKLSADEALDYCRQLAAELDIQSDNQAAAQAALPDAEQDADALSDKLDELAAANARLETSVADLERKLKMLQELPPSYTVVPGDWLRKISGQARIYSDEEKWKRIFRANREHIQDPNLIYPGQVFQVPRGEPATHTVREGETLRIIAGRWEIYGDRNQAGRIFEANRDKIQDPDLIHPGMVLTIPR